MQYITYRARRLVRKVKLDKEVFGVEPNEHRIYLDVKQYLANQRQGTSKAKGRAEMSYSTRKIKKTEGYRRRKSRKYQEWCFCWWWSNFGPEPRDYGFKLNKKVKRLARKSALSAKVASSSIQGYGEYRIGRSKNEGIYSDA